MEEEGRIFRERYETTEPVSELECFDVRKLQPAVVSFKVGGEGHELRSTSGH